MSEWTADRDASAGLGMPWLRARWRMPTADLHFTIDRTVGGVAAGGLRIADTGSAELADELAMLMSLKMAVGRVPLGGATAVVVPRRPVAVDDLLDDIAVALRPFLRDNYVLGEDFASTGLDVVRIYRHACVDPVVMVGQGAETWGTGSTECGEVSLADVLDDEFTWKLTGSGALAALDAALAAHGVDPTGLTAAVQGFGGAGTAVARELHEVGVRVVTIVDAEGTLHDPDGFDVDRLAAACDADGLIDRSSVGGAVRQFDRGQWLDIPAEVLVTAAQPREIRSDNVQRAHTRVRYLVEAANAPVTPAAEAVLEQRGITVVPDFVANAGSAVAFGLLALGLSTVDTVRADCRERIREVVGKCASDGPLGSVRQRALRIATEFLHHRA